MNTATTAEAAQPTMQSAMRNIIVPPLGTLWPEQGGIYLGLMRGVDGKPDYHLITPDGEGGDVPDLEWGAYGKDEPGAKCRRDGLANTLALVASEHTHPAAEAVAKLQINGFTDWYLGSQAEMDLLTANAPELLVEGDWYWTSTQYSAGYAWVQDADGDASIYDKDSEFKARAFRRLLIE